MAYWLSREFREPRGSR